MSTLSGVEGQTYPRTHTTTWIFLAFLAVTCNGHSSTVTDPVSVKKAFEASPGSFPKISREQPGINGTSAPSTKYRCLDDTECDRGHRCDSETYSCVPVPQCEPWEGRENGHKHGECITCRSDTDCGWYTKSGADKGKDSDENDHCWPDGVCRAVPPFFIMTFIKKTTNGTSALEVVVEPASTFTRGQTMCASVIASAADQRDLLDVSIDRIQMCALKQTAKISKYRKGLKEKELAGKQRQMLGEKEKGSSKQKVLIEKELELEQQIAYPYDGVDPYDPLFHDSTGCRTGDSALRVYTVYENSEKKFADYHQFQAFSEIGLPGTSTVCFQALPISPRNVPVYMEFGVSVSRSKNNGSMEEPQGLFEAFGLVASGGLPTTGEKGGGASGAEWNGLVPTSQNIELFIGCPGGKEFDGVAGICERPSVAKELFFWVLLISVATLISGIILFFVQYNKTQQHQE